MHVDFVSTLTNEDEEAFAEKVLRFAATLLAEKELAYLLKIETSRGTRYVLDGAPSVEQRTRLIA
jgi:hypothetical protein